MKKVEVKMAMKVEPSTVIKAFVNPDMLKEWWNVERSLINPQIDQPYVLTWLIGEEGFGYVTSGVIEKYDPQGEIVIKNMTYLNPGREILGPMTLTVRAEKNYGDTQVYLCQDGYQSGKDWDWYYKAVKEAWPEMMVKLKGFLES